MENKKDSKVLLIIIITALVCFGVFLGIYIAIRPKIEDNTNNNVTVDVNETIGIIEDEYEDEEKVDNMVRVHLVNEKEVYVDGKLRIDFDALKTSEERFINYDTKITYNNKSLDASVFKDKVASDSMAAEFKVYKIDDIYILDSLIAAQSYDHAVLILNTDGKVLKTYKYAQPSVEGKKVSISYIKNPMCSEYVTWDDTDCKEFLEEYTIIGKNLK